ncbi:MAG: ice-binding family protein, partial [Actinomycetota bacterium]|nr:ice-binding family protein [Actinomycetota bacterium]
MDGLRQWLQMLWRRSPSTVLIATVATVLGVVGLAVGAILVFGNADDRDQQNASPSTALSFAVLAGSTVNNTGASVVTGDLGGASAANPIIGFPPGILHGDKHGADAVAFQAQTDLTTAYFDAANRTADMELPADLGGMTLVPGVYSQARDLALTGTVTLDGRDDPKALFIFQVGATFSSAPDSKVSLINGARACNVFWQVTTSADLGTNTAFAGTILSAGSASLETGTTVDGRVLARRGEIKLDLSDITLPSCDETPTDSPFAKIGQPPSDSSADPSVPGSSSGGSPNEGGSSSGASTTRSSTTYSNPTGATTSATVPPPLPTNPPP